MSKHILTAGIVLFACCWIISLAIYAHYGYVTKLNKIKIDECIIVGKTKHIVHTGENGDYSESYFYDPGSGDRHYIWRLGKYYTINFEMALPDRVNDTISYRTFTYGSRSEKTRNTMFEETEIGSKTRCAWNTENPDKLYVTVRAHMRVQIIGICFMTILTFIFIVCAVVAVCVIYA